jgi:hypothetical protein
MLFSDADNMQTNALNWCRADNMHITTTTTTTTTTTAAAAAAAAATNNNNNNAPDAHRYHVTGKRYKQRTSHFEPSAPIFGPKDFWDVVLSDIALVAVVAGLAYLGNTHGFLWLTKIYVIP